MSAIAASCHLHVLQNQKAFWAPLHPLRPGGKGEKPLCELSPTEPSWHSVASKEWCFIDFSGCFSPFLFEKMLSPTEVMQKNCAWSWSGVRGQQAALHDSGLRNVQPDSAPASGTVLPQHPPRHCSLHRIHRSPFRMSTLVSPWLTGAAPVSCCSPEMAPKIFPVLFPNVWSK